MLEVNDLRAGYGGDDVLTGISFNPEAGERLAILGPNGCGKSTLLRAITRIIPYRGTITLDGVNIASLSRRELEKKIALLGQSTQVFFPYTVYETVSLGRYAYAEGFFKNLSEQDGAIIEETLKKMDIWNIKDRLIDELSGGQLQRVFLARTLVQDPGLILLDEPTNHLDLKHQVELLEYLSLWAKESRRTVIAVLHDLNLARAFADTAALMNGQGELSAFGKCESVLAGKNLEEVYGLDIKAFMLESLQRWST
jgi:iron complex transport system ATP-binding protein